MEAISDLPMLHDLHADYSPQYVKLESAIRSKITFSDYKPRRPTASRQARIRTDVSIRVAWHAQEMLAANRYVNGPGNFASYVVTWQASA